MPLDSDEPEELTFHLLQRFSTPMPEISEGLPEPKRARAMEWTKYDSKRIELAVTTKMVERQPSDGYPPAFAL